MALLHADDRELLAQFPHLGNFPISHMPGMVKKCPGIPGAHTAYNPKGINGEGRTTEDVRNPT
jgi:hypothetical protein